MADRIAHQVGQRLGDRIQNAFVEIGLPAPDHQFDFFPALPPHVPHNARKAAEQLIDRHHANLHDRVLQVVQDPPLKRHGVGELSPQGIFREALSKFEQRLLQHRFRQDQFADQIEHAVDFFRIHAQQVVGTARRTARRGRFARATGASFAVVRRAAAWSAVTAAAVGSGLVPGFSYRCLQNRRRRPAGADATAPARAAA